MKYKLTIAIVVTVVLFAGAIWENIFIEKTFKELTVGLDEIMQQEIYNLDDINAVDNRWESNRQWLELTIPQIQLNEISVTLGELIGAVTNEDYDSASALLNRTQEYSIQICDMYHFSFINIF